MAVNVLIIEDSVTLAHIIKKFLLEFVKKTSKSGVGCSVNIVKSNSDWLEMAGSLKQEFGTFDFVISDWLLTDGTAYRILKEIIDSDLCTPDRMAIVTGYASYDSDELKTQDKPTSFSNLYDIPIYDKPVGIDDLVHIISTSQKFMDLVYYESV